MEGKHKSTGAGRTGRPKNTASGAWAVNTTREHVVNSPGQTVVLGPLPNRLSQGSEYYAHLAGHTVTQRDKTLLIPGMQVVLSQRDPLPCSTFIEVPEETAPEPASIYATVTLRQHSRQERTIEGRAEDGPRRRGPNQQPKENTSWTDVWGRISVIQGSRSGKSGRAMHS